jgi:hypothetical protein
MGSDVAFPSWYELPKQAGAPATEMRACNCVGPQRGQPVCPCRMSAIKVIDGRYVETIDHGPATVRGRA